MAPAGAGEEAARGTREKSRISFTEERGSAIHSVGRRTEMLPGNARRSSWL